MKRLVCCLDGTWNAPSQEFATNVVRILRAVRPSDEEGVHQITFYDKGVGTGGPVDRLIGGAFGHGLDENVKDGYRFLCNNFEPGDEIYLFGFSRGAFTARSLSGFVGLCGLLDKETLGRLPDLWRHYRTPPDARDPGALDRIGGTRSVRIRCVGVWDTVGALGIPLDLLKGLTRRKYEFHSVELGESIDCALHAVAIDEKRGPFAPTLWRHAPREGQVVEQVWFPGVHSNVGGGYEDHRLADLSLQWMMQRVGRHTPLAMSPPPSASRESVCAAKVYESRGRTYLLSRLFPYQRVIGGAGGWTRAFYRRTNASHDGEPATNEAIHRGALDKCVDDPTYAPPSVAAARDSGVPVVGYDGDVGTA